ncbi:MAG: glycosyltransferase, partial [Candidatus Omnitrophica bacterium]|nr:glycosyltransferase [Candidatus Omnitrophota bacterium]
TASVIVPVFNSANHLPDLLAALSNQTQPPQEVLLVDDGSTDDTVTVAKKLSQELAGLNVRVLEQDHRGPGAARNLGADHAEGEILLFTDSDCLPSEVWVEKMLEPFARDGSVIGVQGAYLSNQTAAMARFGQIEIEDRYRRMKKTPYIDFIGTYAAGYRKEVFFENGKFDDRFPIASGEDADLSFRLASKNLRMVFQPDAVVYHRHPDSLFRYLKVKFWRAYWRNLLYRRHSSRMFKDSYTPQALKFQTLLGLLFPLSFLGYFVVPMWYLAPIILVVLILLFSLPFTLWVMRRDLLLGLATPLILFLRTFAFAAGAARGLLKGLWLNEDYL